MFISRENRESKTSNNKTIISEWGFKATEWSFLKHAGEKELELWYNK